MSEKEESQRIDKWLWAVRVFKTRSLATDACRAGKVKMDGQNVKASRMIVADDIYVVQTGVMTRTVKVITAPHSRVAAKLVPDFMDDLTPKEEYERLQMKRELNLEYRDRGTGRPTKKDRRQIDRLKDVE